MVAWVDVLYHERAQFVFPRVSAAVEENFSARLQKAQELLEHAVVLRRCSMTPIMTMASYLCLDW